MLQDSATETRLAVRPGVKWAARGTAVLFSLLAGLGVGEGFLRWRAATALQVPPRPARPEVAGLPVIEGVHRLAEPGQKANYRGALYTTNSRGFRGPEFTVAKPAGTLRIAMLGDSYTMGSGVNYEESYPAQVEQALQNEASSTRVQVLNLGLSGLSLEGSVRLRLPWALEYDADLLVYGFTVNDLEGPSYRPHSRANRAPSGSLLVDLAHDRWDYLRDITWPSASSYIRELDDNFFRNPAAWSDFLSQLDRLATAGRERNICVIVLLHPQINVLSSWHPYHRHYDVVAAAARERGMYVVDGLPPFLDRAVEDLRCTRYDWHPNAEGHSLLGQALVAGLRALPPSCRVPPVPD